MPSPLPISVVLPTRNSMERLPSHLDDMRTWIPLVREIVVVDSQSKDDTVEFLRRELGRLPSTRFVSHPPGLYASWNRGIEECRSTYVYLSTVGDTMTPLGLQRLTEVADQFAADVAISPPDFAGDRSENRVWPVHDIVRRWNLSQPFAFDRDAASLLALIYFRKSILGSSASNLYRTATMRRFPFPTDFGHAGDVGWPLRFAREITLAVVPEKHSTFLIHGRSKQTAVDLHGIRMEAARNAARALTAHSPSWGPVVGALCDAWDQHVLAGNAVLQAKRAPACSFRPSTWAMAIRRSLTGKALRRAQAAAFTLVRERKLA